MKTLKVKGIAVGSFVLAISSFLLCHASAWKLFYSSTPGIMLGTVILPTFGITLGTILILWGIVSRRVRLKKTMVLLAILTVVTPIATVLLYGQWFFSTQVGVILVATEVTEKPSYYEYFVLTNPDPYTLEALENPGMEFGITFVELDKVTFFDQAREHYTTNVEFKGKHYHISSDSVDHYVSFLLPLLFVELTGLVVCWYVVTHTYLRK